MSCQNSLQPKSDVLLMTLQNSFNKNNIKMKYYENALFRAVLRRFDHMKLYLYFK